VDTPSPLALTQLQPKPRVGPREEILYNKLIITMQGLKDASVVSVKFFVVT